MENLQNIWNWVLPIGGGLTVGAIIVTIGLFILKATFNKAIAALGIDKFVKKVEDTQHEASDKAVERIKEISFKQSIQPIVESELEKVTEKANGYIEGQVSDLRESNERIVTAIAALGAYFEDSIVPDAKKAAFAEAIAAAKSPVKAQEVAVVEEVVEEEVSAPSKRTKRKSEVLR